METGKKRVRAKFDYPNPPAGQFLSFKQGDVFIVESMGQKWWWGTRENEPQVAGWLPPTLLELLEKNTTLSTPTTTEPPKSPKGSQSLKTPQQEEGFVAEAQYKLGTTQGTNYLAFEKSARFYVTKTKKDWWWAILTTDQAKAGWVPSNYCVRVKATDLETTEQETLQSLMDKQKKTTPTPTPTNTAGAKTRKEPEAKVHILVEAQYSLATSQGTNYLTFNKGDAFFVTNQDRKDWWWAVSLDSTQKGWIPGAYVAVKTPEEDKSENQDTSKKPLKGILKHMEPLHEPSHLPENSQRSHLRENSQRNSLSETDIAPDETEDSDRNSTMTTTNPLPTPTPDTTTAEFPVAETLYNLTGRGGAYISFKKGESFFITQQDKKDWWWAVHVTDSTRKGWVPSNYVSLKTTTTTANPQSVTKPSKTTEPATNDTQEDQRLKLEQERLKLEAERLKLEQERMRLEREAMEHKRELQEAELKRREEERMRLQREEEERKAAERFRLEMEKAKLEQERLRLEEERLQFERQRLEHEKVMAQKLLDASKLKGAEHDSKMKEIEEEKKHWDQNSHTQVARSNVQVPSLELPKPEVTGETNDNDSHKEGKRDDEGVQRCRAKKAFVGVGAQQLSFEKGDIIVRTGSAAEGWSSGYLDSDDTKKGVFPATHVMELSKKGEAAKAKADYQGKDSSYLSVTKGTDLLVTAKKRDWVYGIIEGEQKRKGWLPASVVQILADSSELAVVSPVASSHSQKTALGKVKKAFNSTSSDQLSLTVGETVVLLKKGTGSQEGWWHGSNGVQAGWIPASSIEEPDEAGAKIEELWESVHQYQPTKEGPYMAFPPNVKVLVTKKKGEWWYGKLAEDPTTKGWFPSSFVGPLHSEPELPPPLPSPLPVDHS